MSDYNDTLLRTTLAIAVPLWQNEYQRRPLAVVLAIAADKAQMIAEHGDIIMFRGQKRGQSADAFNALASGLAILFGVQAAINMSVNLHLIPAKGMTLPFISYGGSSIISLAYGVGMMLALTRQRPRTEMESIGDANAARSYA